MYDERADVLFQKQACQDETWQQQNVLRLGIGVFEAAAHFIGVVGLLRPSNQRSPRNVVDGFLLGLHVFEKALDQRLARRRGAHGGPEGNESIKDLASGCESSVRLHFVLMLLGKHEITELFFCERHTAKYCFFATFVSK